MKAAKTNRQAFWIAFLKGFAAPMTLFHSAPAPEIRPLPPLNTPWANRTDVEALRGDWERVGNNMKRAVAQYGDEQNTKAP